MNITSWIKTLKVGDKVITSSYCDKDVGTVSRVTKTQVVLTNNDRYLIGSGLRIGCNSYQMNYIEQYTEEKGEEIKNKKKREDFLANY